MCHARSPRRRAFAHSRAHATHSYDVLTVDAYKARKASERARDGSLLGAFYDSTARAVVVGSIAQCEISVLDRGFHRGHGVFDACTILRGKAHALREHCERLERSVEKARIAPTAETSASALEKIARAVIAASGVGRGQVRMYVTSGRGRGFGLLEVGDTAVYVVAYATEEAEETEARAMREGLTAVTSPIPIKPRKYATLKSTNYMPNVHCAMDANDRGADVGVFLTSDGMIGEGPGANVAFLTPDGTLRTPPATDVLAGVTIRRVKSIIESGANAKALRKVGVKKFDDSQPLSAFVIIGAEEAMLIGSACGVKPIVKWDDKLIGDGSVGPATRLIAELLEEDMLSGDARVDIVYE